jgi:uncharacterized membrane protein YphA (DoxX/SURF4 family)
MTSDNATLLEQFDRLDTMITRWMARYGVLLLRISVGIVFFWFGFLKFFPGLSPAEGLASRTIETLSMGLIQPELSLPVLAAWESLIGLGLITGKFIRAIILLLMLQMVGTVMPMFIFPQETWQVFPVSPTLEGQYIIKNLVLVSAAIVIGATVRGGNMVSDKEVASRAPEHNKGKLATQQKSERTS